MFGPATKTLLPLAAIDDIIGVIVFFTIISIVSGINGSTSVSPFAIAGIVLLPFVIGILTGVFASLLMKRSKSNRVRFALLLFFLFVSTICGLLIDFYIFHSFSLNYLLIGMAFSTVVARYLGFTLLPHSGVSLVFTGIATTTLTAIDVSLASIVSGTIVAAAIINEIIAVVVAKFAFKWAGEIKDK